MNSNESLAAWIECWNTSILSTDCISDDIQAIRWNMRADTFGKDADEDRTRKKTSELMNILKEAGFHPEGAKVLDIGCGPGSIALPLAREGASVTALDISSGMLQRLKEDAKRENLSITTIEASWWTADIDSFGFRKDFDLVIASMTPGIRDAETFDRMMACSRGLCYYSNYIRSDPDKIPREIMIRFLKKVPGTSPFASGFMYPFMYLYMMGHRPLVTISQKNRKQEMEWNEAAEKTIDHIQLTQPVSEETKELIRDYYREKSVQGRYRTDYEMYRGTMVWRVTDLQ